MALKETIHAMRQHLIAMTQDLEKASGGNRAAAQRVRTRSIDFAKLSKVFRKESVAVEKGGAKRPKALKKNRKKR